MTSPSTAFELVHTARRPGASHSGPVSEVQVWRSSATGLTVVLSAIPGPLVNGVFWLATESQSDDGCPHTLEHLVFLGSEDYPYKGILDELANRNLAEGTNAWTDVDHTAYTLTTAGQQGFLALLPVYLDHILFPTLTKEGFITEVHHITDSGNDAGVVYCEMQARENTASSRVMLALRRLCYPKHGLSSETGGILHDLRHLSLDTIRSYHQTYYRPENLTLIITGTVDHQQLWTSLETVQQKILRKRAQMASSAFSRPWQSPVPPLQTSEQIVYFPTDDESTGTVAMAWAGPVWSDVRQRVQLALLWRYLSESAVSPLQQALVECTPPYCSSITHQLSEHSTVLSTVFFSDADSSTLDQILPILLKTLDAVVNDRDGFDLERMRSLIGKTRREFHAELEERPHEFVSGKAIQVALYGESDAAFDAELALESVLDDLAVLESDAWLATLRAQVVQAARVTVFGRPSVALDTELSRFEADRVEAQVRRLGADGLAECGRRLSQAEAANAVPAPIRILESFRIPELHQITQLQLASVTNVAESSASPSLAVPDLVGLPIGVRIDSVPTRFVEIRAICDADHISDDLRPYLELYAELLFESDLCRYPSGLEMSYADVIAELDRTAVSWSAQNGSSSGWFACGSFPQLFEIALKMPDDHYQACAEWMRTFLTGMRFTEDRLRTVATRLYNSIAAIKRRGDRILTAATHLSIHAPSCHHVVLGPFRQERFLSALVARSDLTADLAALHRLQAELARHPLVQVVLDAERHADICGPLAFAFHDLGTDTAPYPLSALHRHVQMSATIPSQILVTVAGLDSAYLCRTGALLPSGPAASMTVAAPVRLAIEYLTAVEGPLWKRIRGAGLSYGYGMSADFESGLVACHVRRATAPAAAYAEFGAVVRELADGGPDAFHPAAVDAARASLSFSLISQCDNHIATAHQMMDNTLRGLPDSYQYSLIEQIQNVTRHDLHQALVQYVAPLFVAGASTSRLIVVSGASSVAASFVEDLGLDLHSTTVEDLFADLIVSV